MTTVASRITSTGQFNTNSYIDEVSYNSAVITKNLLKYSQDYSSPTYWYGVTGGNVVLTPTTVVAAPDGTLTATKIAADTYTVYHATRQNVSGSIGIPYTFSTYAKSAEWTYLLMQVFDSTSYGAYFDLTAGTVTGAPNGVTATISPAGNGWYYCSITRTITGTFNSVYITPKQSTAGGPYAGDGTSGIYIWGSQLEASSTPTFYVKTTLPALDTGFKTRTDSAGIYYNAGGFDEVTYHNDTTFAKRDSSTGTSYVTGQFDDYTWSTLPVTGGQIYYLDTANPSSYNAGNTTVDLSGQGVTANVAQLSLGGGIFGPDTTTYPGTTVLNLNNIATSANATIPLTGTIANLDALALTYNFTVMFAAKKNYYGLYGNNFGNSEFFCGSSSGYNSGWRINESTQGTQGTSFSSKHYWTLGFNDQLTSLSVYDSASSTNRMCIVAMTVTASTISAWCNGTLASRSNPQTYVVGTGSPRINATNAGAGAFMGQIGFFAIYNRALSIDEIKQNYNAMCGRYGLPRV